MKDNITKKTNILIVTKLWTGLENFFLKGEATFSGMPSFTKTFHRILESKDFGNINVLLYIPIKNKTKPKLNIPEEYAKRIKVYPFYYSGKISANLAAIKGLILGKKIVKKEHMNLIYGHGKFGAVAGLISKITKIPNVRRLYGAYGLKQIMAGKPRILGFLKDPLSYLTVTLPAEAIIMTNDGTRGDELFNKANLEKYHIKNFYFLLNGVEKEIEKKLSTLKADELELPKDYITMISRIEEIKGQDILIESLNALKRKGVKISAIFVGQVSDARYYHRIKNKIFDYNLESQTLFFEGLSWIHTMYVLKNATVNCLLSKFSNLSNVLLESLILGVPTIAIEFDNNLSYIPDDAIIKLPPESVRKPEIVAEQIRRCLNDEELRKRLSHTAKEYALEHLLDWQERIVLEIEILKKCS